MAVFERRFENCIIDDTKPLCFQLKEANSVNNHIEYIIEVSRYPDIEVKWTVNHRYSDFVNLHTSLKVPSIVLPMLPPKKYFGNTEKEFVFNRKKLLEDYLFDLCQNYSVCMSLEFRKFLDPSNHSENCTEIAHQNLLVSLRSSGTHVLTQTMPHIGTRIRKRFFQGFSRSEPSALHALWWAPYGTDRVRRLKDVHACLTSLLNCQHSYISSAVSCFATESGVCIVRPWFTEGSLRDYIYGVRAQYPSLLKYNNFKRRDILSRTVSVWGRQVLEALAFLHEKGIGHGCLHTGNIMLLNGGLVLSDLENQVLGLPSPLRPLMTHVRKVNCIQAADVYAFGHVLYQMVCHDTLLTPVCDTFPDVDPVCRCVLESILSADACRNGLPSASGLLTHPFFSQGPLRSYEKPSLKLSSDVTEALTQAHESAFERLREDQKKVKQLRQLIRAQGGTPGGEPITCINKPFLLVRDKDYFEAPEMLQVGSPAPDIPVRSPIVDTDDSN